MTKDQLKQLERELWNAADNLRANSDLKSSEYSTPVLGLIFLKFADNNYRRHEAEIVAEYQKLKGTRREDPFRDCHREATSSPSARRTGGSFDRPQPSFFEVASGKAQHRPAAARRICHRPFMKFYVGLRQNTVKNFVF